jgi:rhodanese-related sulfurtransferase
MTKNYLGVFLFALLVGGMISCNTKKEVKKELTQEVKASEESEDMEDPGAFVQYRDITGLVDAKEFHRLLKEDDNALVIDARPYDMFKGSERIKGARVSRGNLEHMVRNLNKEHRIMVYCEKELRSPYVVKFLLKKGFENVYELQGGLQAWRANKLPLVEARN